MGVETNVARFARSCPAVTMLDEKEFIGTEERRTRQHNNTNQKGKQEEEEEMEEQRRRTSIPSTFVYGAEMAPLVDKHCVMEERRGRSFDSAVSSITSSRAASLEVLTLRIQQEKAHATKCQARIGRRRELFRSMKALFSREKKQQVKLLQMQLIAQVAQANRSLVILNDAKTLMLTVDDEVEDHHGEEISEQSWSSSNNESHRRSSFATTIDNNNEKLLAGLENTDQLLAEDGLHHILGLQSSWLQTLIQMHADKTYHVPRAHGGSGSQAMQQFLNEFLQADGSMCVPCCFDSPTPALVRFEKLLQRYRLLKPQLKKALDRVCHDTMSGLVGKSSGERGGGAVDVFNGRDARDVMQSLVREIVDAIAFEARVINIQLRIILRTFVEQMVFSRLVAACYKSTATELDELNATWREQLVKARVLRLDQVGLPCHITSVNADGAVVNDQLKVDVVTATKTDENLFVNSIDAFNRIPYLIPSCVLAGFLAAIRVLYQDAQDTLDLASDCVSADVLLPLLVYVLSRSELPLLHSQVYLMERYAIDESQEGSEAAYYLACLQAAVGYIMLLEKEESERVNE